MRKLRFCFILLLSFLLSYSYAVNDEMPIIAYWGVPASRTTEADFRTFSECGFTVSLYPYPSLKVLVTACRVANKCGVKIIGSCPEMVNSAAQTARTLRNERGFFGYFMQDEPSMTDLPLRLKEIEQLRQTDSTHAFYINLLPYHKNAPEWVFAVTKANSYTEYLQAAAALPCQQLSFDHYPVTTNGIRNTWYHNLEMVRQQSIASGKPFWGFVLSVPHADYPQPTMSALRLQAYSNLAYGAQAIQYFTYWTPANNSKYNFHDAPIGTDGQKTKNYALIQAMNRELKSVAKLFYGARVTSVGHLGTIDEGTQRQTVMPPNIHSLKVIGHQGAIISQLTKDDHHYLAIVNKSHEQSLTVLIKPRNSTPRHLTKSLQEEPMRTSYIITGGNILLFKLK